MPNIDASTVDYNQGSTDAIERTADKRLRDFVSVKDFGATGDGASNDTDAVNSAIQYCIQTGSRLYWPAGTYLCNTNINNYFEVEHEGDAVLLRKTKKWYITPKTLTNDSGKDKIESNYLFVGNDAVDSNDGFLSETCISMQAALNRLARIGGKSLNGQWIISLSAGVLNLEGVRFPTLPIFKNRLVISGPDPLSDFSEPVTTWSGQNSTVPIALRSESNNAPALFLKIQNIKFTDWTSTAPQKQAAAIVVWDAADIEIKNVWADNCDTGAWFWRSKINIVGGRYSNCSTYGIACAYNSTYDVGALEPAGAGVTFENCEIGVSASRSSVGYVKGCSFTNCAVDISCTRHGRVRTLGNSHKNWTRQAYDFDLLSVYTPDNNTGSPDSFEHTDNSAQVYNSTTNSVHMLMQRGNASTVHLVSNSNDVIIENQSGNSVLLSTSNSSFIPFRMPAFAMKAPDIKLELEIYLNLLAGATGTLALNGNGPGTTPRLAMANIPAITSNRVCRVKFTVFRVPGTTTMRYFSTLEETGTSGGTKHNYGTSANPNNAQVSSFSESEQIFRLYWEPTSDVQVRFFGMRTHIE